MDDIHGHAMFIGGKYTNIFSCGMQETETSEFVGKLQDFGLAVLSGIIANVICICGGHAISYFKACIRELLAKYRGDIPGEIY